MRDLSLAYDRSSDDGQASAARSIPRGRNIRLFSDVRWSILLHSLEKNESLVGPLISRVNTRTYGNGMSLAYGSPMGGTTGGFCSVRTITLESAAERARRASAPTHFFLGASGAARLSSAAPRAVLGPQVLWREPRSGRGVFWRVQCPVYGRRPGISSIIKRPGFL